MADNNQDNQLIKQVFKGNKRLLQLIQALMLGLELEASEKAEIKKAFESDELYHIFWKKFHPTLTKDTQVGQMTDVWQGVEEMVFGAHENQIFQAVQYKRMAIEMTKQGLELLRNPDGEAPDISYDPNKGHALQVELLARNQYIKHVQTQLSIIMVIAEMTDDETPQETAKRLQTDSMK